jgi:hypothetical protein
MSTFHNPKTPDPTEDAQDAHMSTFPKSGEKSAADDDPGASWPADLEAKMLNTAYIDNLSTFDSGDATSPDGECCEPGCTNPIPPGNRYLCTQHQPGAA